MSPFHWRENKSPTIFARDPRFTPTVLCITHSEVSSVSATRNIERTPAARWPHPQSAY